MNDAKQPVAGNTDPTWSFLLAEHKELRAEILKRAEMQNQMISFALVAFAGLTTFGLKENQQALLVYPIVALGLAIGWVYNDLQIAQLGLYIRHRIEGMLGGGVGWEHTIGIQVQSKEIGSLAKQSTRGVFWSSTLLTLALYAIKRTAPLPSNLAEVVPEDGLLALSVGATLYLLYTMRNRDRARNLIEEQMKAPPGQGPRDA